MENHTFTHTPQAPHVSDDYQDQRHFTYQDREAGLHVTIMRFQDESETRIEIASFGIADVCTRVSARVTADQCEALARALVDAAHDLRTHNSIEALHRAIVAAEGAAS